MKKKLMMSRNCEIENGMSSGMEDISISVLLLDNLEKYYEGTETGSILKDHIRSLKNGLQFLGKLHFLSIDGKLANRVEHLVRHVKHTLTSCEDENNGVLDIVKLAQAYEYLRELMKYLIIDPRYNGKSFSIFRKEIRSNLNYREVIDLLLENISKVLGTWNGNNNATDDDHIVDMMKTVGELRRGLTYYKPLYISLAHPPYHTYNYKPLARFLNQAAVAIYLLLVGKVDEKTVVLSLQRIMRCQEKCRNLNIYVRFLKFSSSGFSSYVKGQFYILDNLIHILAMNSDSLNDVNRHLYAELKELRTFVANQRGSERLNHYLGLTASTESICYQAVPVVSSCYLEEVEVEQHMHQKIDEILISVIDQIRMIKCRHASQEEIKLYDCPKVDGLGFLEFFLERLKELKGHEKMSVIRDEIGALYTDIHFLVSSPNTSQEKLASEGIWTQIVRLAYQAEYVMDLYLVIPDALCTSTLSNIVREVTEIKERQLAVPHFSGTTTSHVHGPPLQHNNVFHGFEEEIDAMMKYLSGGENDLQVISVVGMAGAGKTSLAMHLFQESSLVGHFDSKAWCTVSQCYQRKHLLLTILNQIDPFDFDIRERDEQEIADMLCRSLKKRRFLVVIDDVWDVSLWSYLSRYFPNDKTRSRILITTRDHHVASKTKSSIHELRPLTEDESYELLLKKFPQQQSLPINLARIAKEVVKSCKGLPLSIVIIGGLMRNAERNEEIWSQIAKDVTSTILSDPQGKCKDILELSYSHLPNHLKSCLLYLGVFPEDYEISVTWLVRLWVAEGFVRGGLTSEECVENVGKGYVDDLIMRSLVIPKKGKTEGGVKSFQLHDLLRDFCVKKAKDKHFFTVLDDKGTFDLSLCPRRICINRGKDKHLPFITLNNIRTIISFCKSNLGDVDIERVMESEHMSLLNVMDMAELVAPASYMHRFVHLRYLAIWNVHRSGKVSVQSSISMLWNLQILILSFSDNHVFEVPDFIWDMVKLRHIHLLPSALFPYHDSKRLQDSSVLLENLMSLSKPRLQYGDSNWLRKLPRLQKLSCIFFTSWDDSLQRYRFPELDLCNRLTSLKVEKGLEGNQRDRCKLHFPASLRKLSLSEFMLDSNDISEIGKSLPNLEVLKLHICIKNWVVNDEDFPTLKVLKITSWCLHEWDASEDSFPNLEQLWLKSCDSLERIPLGFGDIPSLRLISIERCNNPVYASAKEIKKIQVDAQNLELKINLF
ncbi:hypothetical protein Leryth_024186 [Lithospermum erythrorhizon]|nr:hypothetical protein Leryth_024186 [Lithospermum erythrorhizon]